MTSESRSNLPEMVVESMERVCHAMDRFAVDPEHFWMCIDELLTNIPKIPIDESSDKWMLHYRALKVFEVVRNYDDRGATELSRSPKVVFDEVHKMHDELRTPFLKQRKVKPPQTIAQLREEKVPDSQIAREWGFVDKHGAMKEDLYWQEVNEPGSITNSNDWIHPREAEWVRKRMEYREDYETLMCAAFGREVDPVAQRVECPETPEELYRQNVPAGQVARMLGKSIREVESLFAEFAENGVPQEVIPVTTKDGQPLKDYVHSGTPEPKEIDELYSDSEHKLTAERLKEEHGWDRDALADKYLKLERNKLKEVCQDRGIEIRGNLGKETLVERILDHEQARFEESVVAKG